MRRTIIVGAAWNGAILNPDQRRIEGKLFKASWKNKDVNDKEGSMTQTCCPVATPHCRTQVKLRHDYLVLRTPTTPCYNKSPSNPYISPGRMWQTIDSSQVPSEHGWVALRFDSSCPLWRNKIDFLFYTKYSLSISNSLVELTINCRD